MQLRETLRRHLLPRRHTALLAAIVAALAVRPLIGDGGIAPFVFSSAMVILFLVALYTTQVDELLGDREALLVGKRRRSIVGWVLAVPAIAERLASMFVESRPLYLVAAVSWLLFFVFITWAELRGVLKQKEVTGETISMSISTYLLLGITWAVLYILIFERHPEAFNLGGSPATTSGHAQGVVFPILIYFSLTTLATIGYGDITPVTLPARYAAVAEGIAGQLYLAILVARVVGMQMSREAIRDTRNPPAHS
jgi:voltage-gated potassium channel